MTAERTGSTQRAYDRVAVDFAARTASRSEVAARFFDRFCNDLEAGSMVGDLGCGPGHDVGRLLAAGHRCVGVDRATALLNHCPSGSLRLAGDVRSLPLAEGVLDAIWSSAALLHVDRVDLQATFSEWDRVLRPGGVVGMTTSLSDGVDASDEGWELVPASPDRVPELPDGERRWFVHHDRPLLLALVASVGWSVHSTAIRQSHRAWVQLIAVKPDVE